MFIDFSLVQVLCILVKERSLHLILQLTSVHGQRDLQLLSAAIYKFMKGRVLMSASFLIFTNASNHSNSTYCTLKQKSLPLT